jgi:hypothetical protein
MKSNRRNWLPNLLISMLAVTACLTALGEGQASRAQANQQTFPETGKTVRGRFLEYWNQNGGLPQQGYPISDEMQEKSDTDGKSYNVQYFERAVFEQHPENQPPNDVLLSLLGVFLYGQKYPQGAHGQTPNNLAGSRRFPETGKRVGGVFLDYWTKNGGLAQQGFPISDEFTEVSDLDGKTYKVQYFQRAVFELHPENRTPYDVLLSQLGTFRYKARYLQPVPATSTPAATPPTQEPLPTPTESASSDAIPQPPEYAAVRARFENMTPEQWKAAGYAISDPCDPGIGIRVWNTALWEAQYNSGKPDPQNPPILFANRNGQSIIGLQWASRADIQPAPVLFGQQMFLVYPGGDPRLALFSFFKPDGHVLFARSDPQDPCRR